MALISRVGRIGLDALKEELVSKGISGVTGIPETALDIAGYGISILDKNPASLAAGLAIDGVQEAYDRSLDKQATKEGLDPEIYKQWTFEKRKQVIDNMLPKEKSIMEGYDGMQAPNKDTDPSVGRIVTKSSGPTIRQDVRYR